jgi:hypothetical protein
MFFIKVNIFLQKITKFSKNYIDFSKKRDIIIVNSIYDMSEVICYEYFGKKAKRGAAGEEDDPIGRYGDFYNPQYAQSD